MYMRIYKGQNLSHTKNEVTDATTVTMIRLLIDDVLIATETLASLASGPIPHKRSADEVGAFISFFPSVQFVQGEQLSKWFSSLVNEPKAQSIHW